MFPTLQGSIAWVWWQEVSVLGTMRVAACGEAGTTLQAFEDARAAGIPDMTMEHLPRRGRENRSGSGLALG
jgi:hypothetical protein